MQRLPQYPLLVLFCGIPAAGKTTLSKAILQYWQQFTKVYLVCFDQIEEQRKGHQAWDANIWHQTRVEAMQQTAALLTQNPNDPIIVIVDDNMYYRSMRRSYFKLARQCKVGFLTIFIECPLQLALTRNATRGTDQVKESVIQEMVTNFQPPSEAHQWEASHLKINAENPHIDWNLFLQFWAIVPQIQSHEYQDQCRLTNLNSLVHQVDLAARKTVSTFIVAIKEQLPNQTSCQQLSKAIVEYKKKFLASIVSDQNQTLEETVAEYTELFHNQCEQLIWDWKRSL